jgi:hypothetical protein
MMMKGTSLFVFVFTLLLIQLPATAALRRPRLFTRFTKALSPQTTPTPPPLLEPPQSGLVKRMTSPQTALQVTSAIMLTYGVMGVLSPVTLHRQLFGLIDGLTTTTTTTTPTLFTTTRAYLFLFAIREILIASWLLYASQKLPSYICLMALWSVLFGLLPAELYLWGKVQPWVPVDVFQKNIASVTVYVLYLGIVGYVNL